MGERERETSGRGEKSGRGRMEGRVRKGTHFFMRVPAINEKLTYKKLV